MAGRAQPCAEYNNNGSGNRSVRLDFLTKLNMFEVPYVVCINLLCHFPSDMNFPISPPNCSTNRNIAVNPHTFLLSASLPVKSNPVLVTVGTESDFKV